MEKHEEGHFSRSIHIKNWIYGICHVSYINGNFQKAIVVHNYYLKNQRDAKGTLSVQQLIYAYFENGRQGYQATADQRYR